MSQVSPAKPADRFGIVSQIFIWLPVAVAIVFLIVFLLVGATGAIPDSIANPVLTVSGYLVPVLCVVGIVFGIISVVRSSSTGRKASAIAGICVCAVLLIVSVLIIAFVTLVVQAAGPDGHF